MTGASSGIGAEIARALAVRGYPTQLVARREEALTDLSAELAATSGLASEVHAADLGDDAGREAVRDLLLHDERLVGLVNAAGYGVTGRVATLARRAEDRAALDGLVRLNVLALHDLTVAAVGAFAGRSRSTRRSGAILNVSSITAFQPLPGVASYAASKAFVQSFSEAVHAELAGTGVTLTTLSPGLTRTGFADAADTDAFDRAPDLVVGEAADVAEAGVAAMAAGHRSVVPGLVNQLSAAGGRLAPRTLLLPVLNTAMDWFG
ncbi:SDR family NAD(P)-dependent oxidoreductase [Actinomycetospora termitidis]|uniref:SDR family NAD(P)-dependent oxidoreductase n=1 Tax=Actinomycetospora termitidis TaxID=3053470 RepID=A0ABT7MHW3_9PSEU|nr:SDR family NAD(P)-dependent oxidoreductase [Actinomycetospora sp. Odt1-22]MDL5160235.1 SDR family NAD(P)-dependent oxidoreductase [Actinomycetospora sp. Odt1-22]